MIYLVLSKPIFFTGVGIILVLSFNKKIKYFTYFIGSYVWGPLIELSFSTYLVHMFWVLFFFAQLVQPPYLGMLDMILTSIIVFLFSFVLSIPFSFLWVFPFKNLVQLFSFTISQK